MLSLALAFLQQPPIDQAQAQKIAMAFMAILPILFVVVMAIIIIPFWVICKRAGFSPWLSLLCLIPTVGVLVLLYVLAFAEWKVTPVPQVAYVPPVPPPYPPQA